MGLDGDMKLACYTLVHEINSENFVTVGLGKKDHVYMINMFVSANGTYMETRPIKSYGHYDHPEIES